MDAGARYFHDAILFMYQRAVFLNIAGINQQESFLAQKSKPLFPASTLPKSSHFTFSQRHATRDPLAVLGFLLPLLSASVVFQLCLHTYRTQTAPSDTHTPHP